MPDTPSEQLAASLREALECLKRVTPARMLQPPVLGQPAVFASTDVPLDDSLLAHCLHTLVALQQFSCVIELCANVARALDPRDEAMLRQKLNDQGPGNAAMSIPPQRRVELELVYRQRFVTVNSS